MEVNASDDRSPESFRTQLHAATQMKAVMGAEPRPNCLILDEIDGAPAVSTVALYSTLTLSLAAPCLSIWCNTSWPENIGQYSICAT